MSKTRTIGMQKTIEISTSILIVGATLAAFCVCLMASSCAGNEKKSPNNKPQETFDEAALAAQTGAQESSEAPPEQENQPSAGTEPQTEQSAADSASVAPPTPAPTAPTPIADVSPPTAIVDNAMTLVRQGQYEKAIQQCKAALRRSEKHTPAMIVMARAYFHLGKTEFAEAICDIALGIDPNIGKCFNIKGFIALKNENMPLALTHFKNATVVQPSFGPAWLNLGAQYLKAKNYEAAIPALEKAVQLMPSRAETHLNLGSAYRGNKEVVKAQNCFAEALRLKNNNYPDAYFNLGILYLDADSFPGMDRLHQLNTAMSHLNRYKQIAGFRIKDDPVDSFILDTQRAFQREQRRLMREKQKAERAAAKKAAPEESETSQPQQPTP
ncbi:MAG: tetratricopeptide repeat protein [Pseudomonadota bacterium]